MNNIKHPLIYYIKNEQRNEFLSILMDYINHDELNDLKKELMFELKNDLMKELMAELNEQKEELMFELNKQKEGMMIELNEQKKGMMAELNKQKEGMINYVKNELGVYVKINELQNHNTKMGLINDTQLTESTKDYVKKDYLLQLTKDYVKYNDNINILDRNDVLLAHNLHVPGEKYNNFAQFSNELHDIQNVSRLKIKRIQ